MNNETRKALIKSLIGTYYRMELHAPEYQSGHETYERLEIEMQKLMTKNEWETFLNCNEFDNTYWSDIQSGHPKKRKGKQNVLYGSRFLW